MIKPKYSFKKQEFEVTEKFVDREEAKELYHSKVHNNRKEYNVLSFYGVGGIGKSKLRKEICRIHKNENPDSIILYLDFNQPDDRSLGNGILRIVDSCDPKIDFKCFEMAYGLYFRKKNPGFVYNREKEMVTGNKLGGIGFDIFSIFDNGIAKTATEIVERVVSTISNRVIDKSVKEELKQFDEYSLAEMEERLPLFFQYDLQAYLQNHSETKVLIVFDAFEALNENVIEVVHRSRNERWIREFIEYFDSESFPNLLVILFGRDEIEWGEEWNQIIDQYRLEEFDNKYSRKYLFEVGITDRDIIDSIVKGSNGFPLLLYLSAETYANMINSGKTPSIDDFGGNYPDIVERFLYNLDKDTIEVLRLMSIPNYYDISIFEMLIKAFNISFPITEYEQFNRYSFVSYDNRDEEYYIHDLIRKSILEKTPQAMIKNAHKLLLEYYSNRISQEENIKSKYVIQLFFHAREAMSIQEFNKWIEIPISDDFRLTPIEGMKRQQERGEQSTLLQIINGILSKYEIGELGINLVNIYIDIVHLGGDYEDAVSICERYLSKYDTDVIFNDKQLLKMRIRKIHHSMFFAPVDNLIDDAKGIFPLVDSKKYPEEYNELLFLIGGNLGLLSGDFELASKWLDKSYAFADTNGLDSFVHRTIRKQADIMLYHNKYDEALRLINKAIDKDSTIDDVNSRYKIYLMAVLGEIYRKQGDLDTAWNCFEIVDKKCTENFMPGWQAHSYLAKGMVLCDKERYDEAEDYLFKARAIYDKINQKWGLINVEEGLLLIRKIKGELIAKADIDSCKVFAEKMHYRYNIRFAEKIINEERPYLQLFFL